MTGKNVSTLGEKSSEEKVERGGVDVPGRYIGLLVENGECDVAHAVGDETRAGEVPAREPGENIDPQLIRETFQPRHLRELMVICEV